MMFDLRKTLMLAHRVLKTAGVDHALIGGFALATYGHHRATSDIDLLADGKMKEVIKHELVSAGFQLRFESEEVLQFDGPGYLDVLLANRPLSQRMLKTSRPDKTLEISIVRPEDFIGLKIQAYKNDATRELQDKADIQKLLNLPGIDMDLVKTYADLFDEWEVVLKLKARTP